MKYNEICPSTHTVDIQQKVVEVYCCRHIRLACVCVMVPDSQQIMASFPSAEKDTYATILTLWRSELGHGGVAAVDVPHLSSDALARMQPWYCKGVDTNSGVSLPVARWSAFKGCSVRSPKILVLVIDWPGVYKGFFIRGPSRAKHQ